MTETFLDDLADEVIAKHSDALERLTIVFPNRRAGLFFRRALAKRIDKPVWSPSIISADDFIQSLTPLKSAHKLKLAFELYKTYLEHSKTEESFDRFFFWGEVLLKDFEDIDKYSVSAEKIFENLRDQKIIEAEFDFLTEEQKELIRSFWASFGNKMSKHQEDFLKTWEILAKVYAGYQKTLKDQGLGYKGMMHKDVVERIKSGEVEHKYDRLIFAGFNALTHTEEKIFCWFIENIQASVFWDADEYYVSDSRQEAGTFLRMYRKHPVLGKTFPKKFKDGFYGDENKEVSVTGFALNTGQTKLLGQKMGELKEEIENAGEEMRPERTAIIVPDENLLFPVLQALPESFKKLNVTMGYPLKKTSLFGFFEQLTELQSTIRRQDSFGHRQVTRLLRHPYLMGFDPKLANENISLINRLNLTQVSIKELKQDEEFYPMIFRQVTDIADYCKYIQDLLVFVSEKIVDTENSDPTFEKEFIFHFYTEINKLRELVAESSDIKIGLPTFIKLVRQVAGSLRVPFSGEPLNGIQIMGVLETRNLDFDNIFILSMNETSFPATPSQHSFIPYNLRKGYGLPTFEQHDSMYAYLFYRMIQRAKRVHFFYNTEGGDGKTGEMSRFLYQLLHEYAPRAKNGVKRSVLSDEARALSEKKLVARRSSLTEEALDKFTGNGEKKLSPSAINTYLDCRAKFHFRYIARLREPDEVVDEVDPATFGTILHNTLESLYARLKKRKNSGEVLKSDFETLRKWLPETVDEGFKEIFGAGETEFRFEGRNVIARDIVLKLASKVLDRDAEYAPFNIVALEMDVKGALEIDTDQGKRTVNLGGRIDRIDEKDGVYRVVDYKSGQDKKEFSSVESLFDRKAKDRNKAAMQTILYSSLFARETGIDGAVEPAVFNSKELFSDKFETRLSMKEGRSPAKPLADVRDLEEPYAEQLKIVLEEIFHPETDFEQTDDSKSCVYCPYTGLCHRD
ncbi:hypothetical protein FUAX_08110 [Fulvitalea axinellae]|uniref:PD-(D/E)XK endonuclease-like domain-containing protein n=1 Tax=Fulvitalea axinellae TaxID=1182444 RepID=A0AAU9CPT7_9BACT|nr:hypothetical protein FUAX_08110 [Fulvitalea axinellae]